MRLVRILTTVQMVITAVYIAVAVTEPNTAKAVELVSLYLATLLICRYLLWREMRKKKKQRRRHEAQINC